MIEDAPQVERNSTTRARFGYQQFSRQTCAYKHQSIPRQITKPIERSVKHRRKI
jgi:hypothetical protein